MPFLPIKADTTLLRMRCTFGWAKEVYTPREKEQAVEQAAQLKVTVSPALKRLAFSAMALNGVKFSPWVREQLARYVAEHQASARQAQQDAEGERDGQT